MSQRKIGVILSYLTLFVGILSGILYTPILLRILGQAEYGLYSLISSVVSALSVLSFGFSGSYLYFYNKLLVEDGEQGVSSFNGMFLSIFLVISAICLIFGIVLVLNLKTVFAGSLTSAEYNKAGTLMIIMILNLALSFPISVFSSCSDAKEQFAYTNGFELVVIILSVSANVCVLFAGLGSIGLVFVALGFTVFRLAIYVVFTIKHLHVRFSFSGFRLELLKIMFGFTFFIFLNQIVSLINGQVDKVLLGRFLGTTSVAVYSVGSALNAFYQQLGGSVGGVFAPEINRIVAVARHESLESNANNELTEVFIKVSRFQIIILMLILTGFILVGRIFVKLWAGAGYDQSYYIAVGLMMAGSFGYFQTTGDSIQRAKFKHKMRAVLYAFMAILNVIISIPLLLKYGAFGAALGTMIVWLLGDLLFLNWYYQVKLGLNMIHYWKSMFSFVFPVILSLCIGFIIKSIFNVHDWMTLICFVAIYSILYCVTMWLWGMNKSEKKLISQMIRIPLGR